MSIKNQNPPNNEQPQWQLSPEDKRAVDALLDLGFDADLVAQSAQDDDSNHADRVSAAMQLMSLIDQYPTESQPDDLADRVMDRIRALPPVAQNTQHTKQSATPILKLTRHDPQPQTTGLGLAWIAHWREALSVAAAILVMISVLVPMLSSSRTRAGSLACRGNMMGAALGFTAYANDFNDSLPVYYDHAPDGNWLESRANSANLFTLAKSGYVSLATIACPENEFAGVAASLLENTNWESRKQVSLSYQNTCCPQNRPNWGNNTDSVVILSDRNPLVDAVANGSCNDCSPDEVAMAHGPAGFNIMLNDGSARWTDSPWINGDNMWLPSDYTITTTHIAPLKGTELPTSKRDAMMLH